MDNKDTKGGLRLLGGQNVHTMVCKVSSSYATALAAGDPVVLAGTAETDPRTGDRLIPTVEKAAVGSTISGVIVGIVGATAATAPAIPTNNYIPASTGGLVIVCDDPEALFVIQEDSDSENMEAADVGEFCDLVFNAMDTTTGLSQVELDSSNAGTGDNVRIMGLYPAPDNAVGANADWIVKINEHTFKAVSTPK